jgi:4-oxalocrotonate tautomerase
LVAATPLFLVADGLAKVLALSYFCSIADLKEVTMPVVHIYMYKGRTREQKNELVKRISKNFEEVASVKPASLNILFHDMDKEDWGVGGSLASEQLPK